MLFSPRIIYHLPEDSAFFPEDRMRFYQRINVHLPEDRLCHFPKTYYYSLWLYPNTIINTKKFFSGQQNKKNL